MHLKVYFCIEKNDFEMFDDFENFDDELESDEIVSLVYRFEEMLKANSNSYFDQGEFEDIIDYYLNNFNTKKAGKAIQHAHRLYPNSIVFLLRKAQLLVSDDKTEKALEVLKQAESIDSENSELFLTKGSVYSSIEQHEKAISEYKKALLNTDEQDDIYLNIAYSYQKMGKYRRAQEYYMKCLEVSYDNYFALEEICYCFICNNDLESGIDFFIKQIEKDPYSYISWFNLGNMYFLSHQFEKSIDAYDYALAIESLNKYTYIPALHSKAKAYICLGKIKEAEEMFNEAIDVQLPDAETFAYIGECFDEMDVYDKAIEYYKKAIEFDPTYAESYARIASIKYEQEKNYSAVRYYQKAIKHDPLNSYYHFALGECYLEISKFLEAESCFLKASRLENPHEHLWLRYSEIFSLYHDYDNAINILKRGLTNQPENASIFFRLFCYYFYLRQFNKAEESLIKALSIDYDKHQEVIEFDKSMENNNIFSRNLNNYNS